MSGHPTSWPRAVVFDLDGTFVDSAPDLAGALNKVLAADGLAPFDLAAVRGFIGNGITRLVELGYEGRERPLVGDALKDKVAVFKATYLAGIAEQTVPYPGAVALAVYLRASGIKIGICTNKAEPLTFALLEGLDLALHFDAVVGGTEMLAAKPAPDMLLETLRLLDVAPDAAAMVGDSETDVACARAAGIPVIGVTFGYTKTPMRELRPDAVVETLDEVPAALAALASTIVS